MYTKKQWVSGSETWQAMESSYNLIMLFVACLWLYPTYSNVYWLSVCDHIRYFKHRKQVLHLYEALGSASFSFFQLQRFFSLFSNVSQSSCLNPHPVITHTQQRDRTFFKRLVSQALSRLQNFRSGGYLPSSMCP